VEPELRPVDDVLGPRVRLLLVGINPSVMTSKTGLHFARPGNRFWPALSASGLLSRPLGPEDQHLLPDLGIGITNLAPRPSARADEVTAEELRAGGAALAARVDALGHPMVAVLGVTAYRIAFGAPRAVRVEQPDRPGWWLLDNPSGLNAHAQIPDLAAAFAAVGRAAGLPLHPVV
jgi:double-stranded uracil-DNA glycosylase